jgi:preprotein translocase subunit SecG
MENVVLVIHLILALCLIGVVLLQRSEGGGLGIGGGGGAMSGRSGTSAVGKLTWFFAVAFLTTSIALTVIAAQNAAGGSVLDSDGALLPSVITDAPVPPTLDGLLPPSAGDAPALPPRAD